MLIRNRTCIDLDLNKTVAPSGRSLPYRLPLLSVSQIGSTRERQRQSIRVWEEDGLGYLFRLHSAGWPLSSLEAKTVHLCPYAQFFLGSSNCVFLLHPLAWVWYQLPPLPQATILYSDQSTGPIIEHSSIPSMRVPVVCCEAWY